MEVANQEPRDEEERRRENPEQEPHALVLGRHIAELFSDGANVVHGFVLEGKIWETGRINERVTFIGLESEVCCSPGLELASFRERILNTCFPVFLPPPCSVHPPHSYYGGLLWMPIGN